MTAPRKAPGSAGFRITLPPPARRQPEEASSPALLAAALAWVGVLFVIHLIARIAS